MKKYEQQFCSDLIKWLNYNWKESCIIEAKIALGNEPFNIKYGFKEHQIPMLINVNERSLGYKISDLDRLPKPYDIVFSYHQPSYVAIKWIRRGNKTFYLIKPQEIVLLANNGYKSITEDMARKHAYFVGKLK